MKIVILHNNPKKDPQDTKMTIKDMKKSDILKLTINIMEVIKINIETDLDQDQEKGDITNMKKIKKGQMITKNITKLTQMIKIIINIPETKRSTIKNMKNIKSIQVHIEKNQNQEKD